MFKRPSTSWVWLGCVLLASAARAQSGGAPAPAEPPVAIERFFAQPAMHQAALSPSGRWLGALSAVPGRRIGFHVVDLDGKEGPRTVEASPTDDVAWFQWADDDWVIFGLRDTERKRYVFRGSGVLAMRRDGSDARQLIARGWRDQPEQALSPGYVYLGLGAPGSQEVIVGDGSYDRAGDVTYLKLSALHIVTQKRRRLYEDAPRATGWLFDARGRPRVVTREDDKEIRYYWGEAAKDGERVGPWREIGRMPLLDTSWRPAYVDGEGQLYVNTLDAQGFSELRLFDLDKRQPAAPALLKTPGFSGDIAPVRAPPSTRVVGVDLELDAPTVEWFDPVLKALQERIDARWPGRVNVMNCTPCDSARRVLVYSYADNDPGHFLLFEPQQDKWLLLGTVQPDIDPARMARMSFERIRARDGRDLPVWVTRTPGPPTPRPAVVLLHGGPHMRGTSWGWNAEVQFLASRGYVVIEPEFRGSTGYGELHHRAGWKQWGGTMVDDVTDALRHVVAAGIADPKRVCVMGSSYGGYATLMSLVKEPAMYRCGVAHAALTDLRHRYDFHWSDLSRFNRRVLLPLTMGDRVDDAQMFIDTSPIEQVKRIQAPVLLLHGDDDYRVPIENGERMRDALKKAGKPVEWVEIVDEGHGFSRPASVLNYWRRVEAFLARHLK